MGPIGEIDQCPLCDHRLHATLLPNDNSVFQVTCDLCKTYGITDTVLESVRLDGETKRSLTGVVRRSFELNHERLTITADNWELLAAQAPAKNDVLSKVHCLLHYIARKSHFPGEIIALTPLLDYPVCFAVNSDELAFYFQHIVDDKFVESHPSGIHVERHFSLTPNGF
jgi:hypothetical protein